MSLRLRLGALAGVLLVAGAVTAIVLSQSGAHAASGSATGVPPGYTTATVERRTLVESSKVDGTLGYGGTAELYDRLAGTFTWLPAVGAVIGRGGTLFKVDNLPVVLMYGSVPAYRAMKEGVADGPDVQALNANLVALGYDPERAITVDGHFSEATAAAVRRWQKAEGLTESGQVELGRVIFAPGARRVTTLHVGVGEDPPPSESEPQSPSGNGPGSGTSPSSEGSSKPEGEKGSGTPSKGGTKPAGSPSKEGASSPGNKGSSSPGKGSSSPGKGSSSPGKGSSSPGKGSSSPGKGSSTGDQSPSSGNSGSEGSGGKEGSPSSGSAAPVLVMGTTADRQIVQLQVKADQQELAHAGEHVPVTLPDGTVVHGRITEVGTVASESSGSESEKAGSAGNGGGGSGENATISVSVALDHPVAHLDKAPVSVELVKQVRHNVLTVPATALVATAGGGFAVQVLQGGRRVELAVTPGLFANGYVEVEGPAIREGVTVLEPE